MKNLRTKLLLLSTLTLLVLTSCGLVFDTSFTRESRDTDTSESSVSSEDFGTPVLGESFPEIPPLNETPSITKFTYDYTAIDEEYDFHEVNTFNLYTEGIKKSQTRNATFTNDDPPIARSSTSSSYHEGGFTYSFATHELNDDVAMAFVELDPDKEIFTSAMREYRYMLEGSYQIAVALINTIRDLATAEDVADFVEDGELDFINLTKDANDYFVRAQQTSVETIEGNEVTVTGQSFIRFTFTDDVLTALLLKEVLQHDGVDIFAITDRFNYVYGASLAAYPGPFASAKPVIATTPGVLIDADSLPVLDDTKVITNVTSDEIFMDEESYIVQTHDFSRFSNGYVIERLEETYFVSEGREEPLNFTTSLSHTAGLTMFTDGEDQSNSFNEPIADADLVLYDDLYADYFKAYVRDYEDALVAQWHIANTFVDENGIAALPVGDIVSSTLAVHGMNYYALSYEFTVNNPFKTIVKATYIFHIENDLIVDLHEIASAYNFYENDLGQDVLGARVLYKNNFYTFTYDDALPVYV